MNKSVEFGIWLITAAVLAAIAFYDVIPLTLSLILSLLALVFILPKHFVKNWKIIIWIFFLVITIIIISPNLYPKGMYVTSVSPSASSFGISTGDIIYKINNEVATQDVLSREYYDIIRIETSRGTKVVRANGTLGIAADVVQPTNLRFGLDLKGGVRAIVEPNSTENTALTQIISTLENRINFYGLRESVFRPVYYDNKGFIEISIAGGTKEELTSLIESQGNFDARIPLRLPVAGGIATLVLDKTYTILVTNLSINVNNETVRSGETFSLSGIDVKLNSIDRNSLNITARVFGGDDIVTVFLDPQRSRIERLGDGSYSWTFGVQLSSFGAQKFAWVTQNINTRGDGYLESPIEFYLDGRFMDSLNIQSLLKGRVQTEVAVSGSASTSKDAQKEMTNLQSILRSGALPVSVEIVQLDTISPTLGSGFLKNAAIAALAAMAGVVILVSIRYRKPKLVLPMIIISISEIMIVAGLSTAIGWTIDLAAIAGLIASVGTGISDQIIILDRTLRKESEYDETLRQKIKNAFFVVFGTAGTIIAAMLPLLFTGFGILRGFALITIIGVLVGIFITRPAYGIILESIKKD